MRNKKGITLILLIITVAIMVILTSVVINIAIGDGASEKIYGAGKKQNEATAIEDVSLIIYEAQFQHPEGATLSDVEKLLNSNPENNYEVIKIAKAGVKDKSGKVIVPEVVENIYVTDKKYGVHIEINKELNAFVINNEEEPEENSIKEMKVSIEPYTTGDVAMGAIVTIKELPSEEYINYNNSKYVITTSKEEMGTDESLYTDGTLTSGIINGVDWSVTKGKKTGTYYAHILLVNNEGAKAEIITDTSAEVVGTKTFTYTGEEQNITLLAGKYKMECWGAQGGSNLGGKGAYTSGALNIDENQTFYIYVGATTSNTEGGYNGGGTGANYGGGGSTDIRLINGSWNNTSSMASRIMVASGGSGGYIINGASGGTINGQLISGATGTVATQKSAGTQGNFGYAGSNSAYTGAGGGYYGGGTATKTQTMNTYIGEEGTTVSLDGTYKIAYGANESWVYKIFSGSVSLTNAVFTDPIFGVVKVGYKVERYDYISSSGNSYISGHQGCIAIKSANDVSAKVGEYSNISDSYHYSGYYFTNTNMISGDNTMPTVSGGNETGHTGNGCAKITYIEE